MGYTTRNNGDIRDFWPDDTDTEFYISSGTSIWHIIEMCKERWPDTNFSDIEIAPDYIHTSCLTYDSYDQSDYTNFLIISRNK